MSDAHLKTFNIDISYEKKNFNSSGLNNTEFSEMNF